MEIGFLASYVRSPQCAAAGCRTRTHYQDPWPAINILVDSLWYIHTVMITLLFIKVTELFGIQSKKCFSIINTFSLLIDRLFTLSLQEAPPHVCPHLNCDQTATVSSMMVCWVGDTSPWPGVTRSTRSRLQERGDMAVYWLCAEHCVLRQGEIKHYFELMWYQRKSQLHIHWYTHRKRYSKSKGVF